MHRRLEIAWLAGIFDGEGCVGWQSNDHSILRFHFTIGMTHFDTIVKVSEILDREGISNTYWEHGGRNRPKHWKPCYVVGVRRTDAVRDFCKLILPYSVTKKDELQIALECCRMMLLAPPRSTSNPEPRRAAMREALAHLRTVIQPRKSTHKEWVDAS